ncbi:2-succinylbenzoate--CoA ligase [Paraburkholderia caffeinitolerans]|uniref:2-succinylbenzoate--CoA ligase n=1 Tax=Paraburkholderia caffeinitolerans TaxID=1723730 RepID=A0A6J5GF43_9BURK|nr:MULTISPECIES: feruloyl-CoA synthase [Paraburkholderia]CAB3795655.1 2-succinylbenzoate--CoA ligase [Paraburkholderia caffeinitolerans]
MTTLTPSSAPAAAFRPVRLPSRQILVERRSDGSLILRSANPPPAITQTSFADFIEDWAAVRGDTTAFAERDSTGEWRRLSWRDLWQQVRAVGAALLEMGLGQARPLTLLSGNSIEQAVVLLAAEYVGIPTAPVSPAYSTLSKDFARLNGVIDMVPPAALFVQDGTTLERALAALEHTGAAVIAVRNVRAGQTDWATLAATELTPARAAAVAAAHAAISRDATARVLFTSGSTGMPKGVNLTYGNFKAVAAYFADNLAFLRELEPVFLDWLPWHHGLGGVLNFGRSIQFGATHFIDDGRPLPGLVERTVRNLREVAPTIFTTVPSAWTVLANELERDDALAANLFSKVHFFGYGGASLPTDVWQRIQRVAQKTTGERITFTTGLACTETSGMGTYCGWPAETVGNIGTPAPGSEVKLLPLEGGDGRYEIRMRGANVFGGYIKQPELTAAAFDEEGFFRIGDAVRLADPEDPSKGLLFAGRVVEDFKLTNGTWVRTGAVRLALLDRCAPLLTDAVICGHDHDYLAALAWPNVAACRRLAPELEGLDAEALVQHPRVVAELGERLRRQGAQGASLAVERLMLMAEPPSMDANEIAEKGYVNQAVTRARRAHLIDELYVPEPAEHIARAR